MRLSDFDYYLPVERIAQHPVPDRESCRLMVLRRDGGGLEHRSFGDISGHLREGDCLVLNDTKVMASRLFGKRPTGGRVEIFLLEKKDGACEALVRPAARVREGERVRLESGDEAEILGRGDVGRLVSFSRPVGEIIERAGHVPLPPYIDRPDGPSDRSDYQTVYGAKEGATASPTAGLHFTKELLGRIEGQGVSVRFVTLHTSYGTFAPIKTDEVEGHRMHSEYFEIPEDTVEAVERAKKDGGKVFAVGTTSARSLEYWAKTGKAKGDNDLFIYPGFNFRVIDGLITNFHLPKSTLLLLVSAFAGRDLVLDAYRRAIEAGYRFFSYGDAMLIV
jgi:S-adenosylmethionine:tRNA ribosyltransferase-isomerase